MDSPSNILAFGRQREYQAKHDWLVEHGYISYADGIQVMPLDSVAILCDLSKAEIESFIVDGRVAKNCISAMRDSAQKVMNRYGTNDLIEVLYAAANGRDRSE